MIRTNHEPGFWRERRSAKWHGKTEAYFAPRVDEPWGRHRLAHGGHIRMLKKGVPQIGGIVDGKVIRGGDAKVVMV